MSHPCRFGRGCRRPDCHFLHLEGRDIDDTPVCPQASWNKGFQPSNPGAGGVLCRFSRGCTRPDCHFNHPDGRAIDSSRDNTAPAGPHGPGLDSNDPDPYILQMEMEQEEQSQILRDTWYPQARNCACCKGFIYGCSEPICSSLGKCVCTIEEDDMATPS